MAKVTLPVDFLDDILKDTMNGRRRYKMVDNGDGTVSFEDVSEYDQIGSSFGQAQINATNQAVNESVDKAVVVEELADVAAVTEVGFLPGAKAVAELNKKLSNFQQSFQDGCSTISAAITEMGVATADNASPETMAANIKNLNQAASGVVSNVKAGNTITCGFKPNHITFIDVNRTAIMIYDANYSTTEMLFAYSNAGAKSIPIVGGGEDYPKNILTLTDTGFTFINVFSYDGDTCYWFASK